MTDIQTLIYDIAFATTNIESSAFVIDSIFQQWAVRKIENAWIQFCARYSRTLVAHNEKSTDITYTHKTKHTINQSYGSLLSLFLTFTRRVYPDGTETIYRKTNNDPFYDHGSFSRTVINGLKTTTQCNMAGQILYIIEEDDINRVVYRYNKKGQVCCIKTIEERDTHCRDVDCDEEMCSVEVETYFKHGVQRKVVKNDLLCWACRRDLENDMW